MILIQQHQQLNINKENDNNIVLDVEEKQTFNDIFGVTELCCFVKENYTGVKKSSNVNADDKVLANANKNNLSKIRYFEIKKQKKIPQIFLEERINNKIKIMNLDKETKIKLLLDSNNKSNTIISIKNELNVGWTRRRKKRAQKQTQKERNKKMVKHIEMII